MAENILKELYELTNNKRLLFLQATEPLKNYGISHFSYYVITKENRAIYFCSNDQWNNHHYLNEQGFEGLYRTHFLQKKLNFKHIIFTGNPKYPLFSPGKPVNGEAMIAHNLWNAISYYENSDDTFEAFNFFAGNDKEHLIPLIIKNEVFLRKYISYFREQFLPIIQQIDTSFFYELDGNYHDNNASSFTLSLEAQKNFVNLTPISKYPILNNDGQKVFITETQANIIKEISIGTPFKKIANSLKVTDKTIELYWNRIKAKTGFQDKNSIITSFLKFNRQYI